ncbi:MAG: ABC transporter permease, partial [Flavobacteriales bacterium]|nr:ABC transporter permease [Flavobacteriales bacterium]
GIFSINMEYDSEFLLVPIAFAKDIMDYDGRCNYVEIDLKESQDIEMFQKELEELLPEGLFTTNRFEKNAVIYKANESERLVTILILSFIILIAVFNILASLTMLMLDKSHDLSMLHSMGAPVKTLRRIFFLEGILISGFGALIGIVIGVVLCYLQTSVGLVRLQGGIVDFYPVLVMLKDVLLVFAIVMVISIAFSWIPVNRMTRGMLMEASDRKR